MEISNESNKELNIILLICQQAEKSSLLNDVISCFNENIDSKDSKTCFSLTINKIIRYFNLLHLFPIEYFTKQEISNLSLLTLLVDKWVSVIKAENCGEFLNIIKCSILCRNLICKFTPYMNRKDDIIKKDSSFIIWWISSISAYQKDIISHTNGMGNNDDDTEAIQNLFEHFIQITCKTVTLIIRQVLVNFQDDNAFKTGYLNRIVDYLKNLVDGTGESLSKKKDSSNDNIWRITFEFLKLGIELAESQKQSKIFQLNSKNPVWKSFLILQSVVEKNLNRIFSDIFDKSIQEIQCSNDSNDLKWKENLSMEFALYNNELKTYKICLQYYHLNKDSELEVIGKASNIISLLSKSIKITTSILRTSSLKTSNTLGNEVALRQCIILLSIIIDFIHIIEYECNENTLLNIFKFVCDLMKIFYNEDSKCELSKELDAMFNSIISRLSNGRYDIIASNILSKLEISSFSDSQDTNEYDKIFLIHLIDIFLNNSNYGQLRRLEQKLPNLLCGIGNIAELINKVTHGIQIVQTLKFLICHRAFSFQSMDIGLVLSTVISLTSPKRHYELSEEQEFKGLFEEICYLLFNILIHRREQLYHIIPTFIFIIQSMFHCFKKTQKSLKDNLKEMQQKEYQGRNISWWEVHIKNPLPIESAKIFARLLITIPHNKKSDKSSINKAFTKHIPSLLSEYIYIQTKNNILDPNIRDVLKNGIYSLLELCGQFERDMIMVNLDIVGKNLFKSLWMEYNKEWKYVGRG
ncbi:Urb2/Npa2 family-domain-containing protein [Glomus cerebriforme]|uniref:Urb2/Npa2 family-domain-containing protein n=1 Tax=Glomus cerebriforme TaxID=658196 RepID=A0A397T528_9GLOM|nr:Urb2/Npa2 family-domain-containing protein [Glomus cerebriforme]